MKQIRQGTVLRTNFLTGRVMSIIDGRLKKFWEPTLYFNVKVLRPYWAIGTHQIIRLDEIKETGMKI